MMKMKSRQWLPLTVLLLTSAAHADRTAGTPDDWGPPMHKPGPYWKVAGDRLESGIADGEDSYAWEAQGWYGYDFNRLRWKTEGEGRTGSAPEHAELQLLFSRLFAPYWEWQLGVRHDFRPSDGRSFLVAGLQGVAPYEFEIDAAAFVSEDGDVSMRFEAEYELLLTQRWILQPGFAVDAALSGVPEAGVASGINSSELGLRLRYEMRREFAPYVGIEWRQSYGNAADRLRSAGEETSVTSLVAGLRFWF